MRRILQFCVALGTVLASATSLNAQSNSTLGPATDRSVTTGIGSSSSIKTIRPGQALPDASRSVFWYMPGMYETPREDKAAEETKKRGESTAPPPPAAEVKEDPRTMITRDRIESPQHR
jgi:hypothetical protein